jgi:ribosomal protein L44E
MPEPNRPPWRFEANLGGWPFWSLVEQRVTVELSCDACHHRTQWTPEFMERKFRSMKGKPFASIAYKLRCSQCRSEWVAIGLARGCFLAK